MKKALLLTLFAIVGLTAFAQTIHMQETPYKDYLMTMKLNGYETRSFDFSQLRDSFSMFSFIVQEYQHDTLIKEESITTIPTIFKLSDCSEADRQEILKENEADDPEHDIHMQVSSFTIGFTPIKSDTIEFIRVVTRTMFFTCPLLLKKLCIYPGHEPEANYMSVPYDHLQLKAGAFSPLVLYGSSWYDKQYNIYRFCGESKLYESSTNTYQKYCPHYYILGIVPFK